MTHYTCHNADLCPIWVRWILADHIQISSLVHSICSVAKLFKQSWNMLIGYIKVVEVIFHCMWVSICRLSSITLLMEQPLSLFLEPKGVNKYYWLADRYTREDFYNKLFCSNWHQFPKTVNFTGTIVIINRPKHLFPNH